MWVYKRCSLSKERRVEPWLIKELTSFPLYTGQAWCWTSVCLWYVRRCYSPHCAMTEIKSEKKSLSLPPMRQRYVRMQLMTTSSQAVCGVVLRQPTDDPEFPRRIITQMQYITEHVNGIFVFHTHKKRQGYASAFTSLHNVCLIHIRWYILMVFNCQNREKQIVNANIRYITARDHMRVYKCNIWI